MKMTPLDIQQQQFKIKFRGFDVREVDTFLEQMADAFESLQSENNRLQQEIKRLQLETQGYREREESFKRAMLNSQKVFSPPRLQRSGFYFLLRQLLKCI